MLHRIGVPLGLFAACSLFAGPASAAPFSGAAIDDAELGSMRGGFTLPNGIEVALAVRTETQVNGATVLLSEYRINTGVPQLAVFVPRSSSAVPETSSDSSEPAAPAMPTLDYRDQMLVVTPGRPTLTVSLGGAASSPGAARDDLMPVGSAPGVPTPTPSGLVTVTGDTLRQVRLEGNQIDTSHFFGTALGSLTVNTGNDRVIDTVTSIDINLSGATPDLAGSSLLTAQSLALDATAAAARGGL